MGSKPPWIGILVLTAIVALSLTLSHSNNENENTAARAERPDFRPSRVIVLACDTNATKNKGRIRWEHSLDNAGMKYRILGTGEKWGGERWRLELYHAALQKVEQDGKHDYVILTDCWDVVFQRTITHEELELLDNTVVVGTEKQRTAISWEGEIVEPFYEKYPQGGWFNLNGGFAAGRVANLRAMYEEALRIWTPLWKTGDQHILSIVLAKAGFSFNIELDTARKFV